MFTRTRTLLSLLALVFVSMIAVAQDTTPPRYFITAMHEGLSTDGCGLALEYFIQNRGGPSASPATVELRVASQPGVVLASAPVDALAAGEQRTVNLAASVAGFPENTNQIFEIHVVSAAGQSLVTAPRTVTLSIPSVPDTCRNATAATIPVNIPLLGYTVDLANLRREEILLAGGMLLVLLLLLLILLRLRKLLFGRAPAFGNHLPPYATTPPIDPYSQSGIRQSWQPYAQNNTITQPSVRGTNAVVKLLLGADGQYLNGWTITALRLSQYDQYGRVARTYTAGPLSVVRTLNRLAHSRTPLDQEQIERKMTPVARQLTRLLLKRITQRSAVLPVALDLRLKGHHGEVSIVFELYTSDGSSWFLLDRWQPEMTVVGKTIYETYTYTIHGQSGGESFKDFRQRLPLDMARLLTELIAPRVRPPTPSSTQTQLPKPSVTPESPMAPIAPPTDTESKG